MAGIAKMNDLAARKQALVAESEVHRQTLTLEFQNLHLYIARQKRKFGLLRLARPLLLVLPILGPLLALKRKAAQAPAMAPSSPWRRALSGSLVAWRLYRKFGPVLHQALGRRRRRNGDEREDRTPAADI